MIAAAKEDRRGISERELCGVFGVSRSWYRERPSPQEKTSARATVPSGRTLQ